MSAVLRRLRQRKMGTNQVSLLISTMAVTALLTPSISPGSMRIATLSSPSRTTTSHVSAVARPSDLVQGGDSKTRCIYVRLGADLRQAEGATGVTYNCLETFNTATLTWEAWVNPWLTQAQYGYREWLGAAPTKRTIILTQALVPANTASDASWRAQCAAGRFVKYAHLLAANLIARGFSYSVIRLGPEMNGVWTYDTIGNTRSQWRQWAECYASIVRTMRSLPDSHFLFDWNVNAGVRAIPLNYYYPGNAYVDLIGIDFYDAGGGSDPPSAAEGGKRWAVLTKQPLGLNAVYSFATQHRKPLSLPEWGTVNIEDTPTAGGDDGSYVAHIGNFVASHDVAYESWFDGGDDGIYQLSWDNAPNSLRAYVRTIARATQIVGTAKIRAH